jgi:hypothetical protein
LLGTVAILTVANIGLVARVWLDYKAEYHALKRSFGMIERGSRVLIGHSGTAPDPPDDLSEYPAYHAPTLAVHYASAFVPTLFAYAGKQPVQVVPAFKQLAIAQGGPAPIQLLKSLVDGSANPQATGFVGNWHRKFEYLYLLGPHIANPIPGLLEELATASRFTLYRINRPALGD